jgi:diguanylate cyclase (GGDEF)-like protein
MNAVLKPIASTAIRVLIADDETSIHESYREILKGSPPSPGSDRLSDLRTRLFGGARKPAAGPQQEFDLLFCSGAEEAVQAVRNALARDNPFDLVFLDMRMPPGPNGVWAAEQIRALDGNVDIVVATAYSDINPEEIAQRVPPTGSLFYLQKPFHVHEVRQLASALGRRRQAEERIRQLAYFDQTTGLPNRALFREQLRRALEQARRNSEPLAVLFMDLDNFKRVNDTLGHSTGDLLLAEVSKRLLLNLRTRDAIAKGLLSAGSEVLARLGGDEFTVLLSSLCDGNDAGIVCQRLLKALSRPIRFGEHEVTISASIGIAVFPDDGADADALLKAADMAMYFAKREGRNGYQFYTEAMNESALKRLTLENHLRRALERGELSLHYQPQLDIATREVVGVEALIRWNSQELGPVCPVEFIPIAEESGLILAIGEWVLRTACAQCKAWQDEGISLERIGVNVSVRQFAQDGFPGRVAAILAETGLAPEALELEITESVLIKDGEAALTTLRALKALGVKLAIDDFGTGYSSLSYLKQFPIDHLKIDRSFVCAINTDPDDQAIATAVIAMGQSMHLRVTAEGVETEGQLSFLSERRCSEAQGFLLCRPLPAAEARAFLALQRPRPIGRGANMAPAAAG